MIIKMKGQPAVIPGRPGLEIVRLTSVSAIVKYGEAVIHFLLNSRN